MTRLGTVRRPLLPACVAACTALALPFPSGAHDAAADSVGTVDFRTSCDAATGPAMNRALAQLHNMMYLEAEALFADAAKADPDCAMLHWGMAMTTFHPLWPGTSSDPEMARGRAAVAKAREIGGGDERERAYIDAVAAFYEGGPDVKMPTRIAAWAAAQESVRERFPDDVDAAAFYALAHLAVAPKGDRSFTHQREAGELLEALHAANPEHPAGFHYLIHAYDNPLLASRGEAVSRAYDKLAPEVPHALHMPSHVFVRMGLWNETIFWNERSARAALDAATDEITSTHYAHAMDYRVYAHLQRGEERLAREAVEELLAVDNHQDAFSAAYALAAAPVRVPLETEDWRAASELPDALHGSIGWERFPATVGITHFARGIGAARSGRMDEAEAADAELGEILARLTDDGDAYWATLANAQQLAVRAWIAEARGEADEAARLMLAAADAEDSVAKSPVTPSAVLPARELYADLLALHGDHAGAVRAYEATLAISPNRARSLRGVARSAEAMGDADKARRFEDALRELVASAAPTRRFVAKLDAASGERVSASQLAAARDGGADGPERRHGVSLLEEFRSGDVWFQSFGAADIDDVRGYLAALGTEPAELIESAFVHAPEVGGGPKAGAVRDGHAVYVIERDLPGAGDMPEPMREEVARGSQAAIETLGDGIEWDHSYVTAEGTFCVYRAEDPALIEEHARLMGIPADPITEVEHVVRDLDFGAAAD